MNNVLLNESDHELDRRSLRFARYTDDMMIFCKIRKASKRVFQNTTTYLEEKLLFKVNQDKSEVVYIGIDKVKFLGCGFYIG